jgi:hypothetical protein
VLFPLFFSIAAIVLGALAIAGSTSNHSPINQIYLFQMNITGATSAVNSQITSETSLESLGLSDIYTFGMWGYCRGSSNSNGDYTPTWCSEPKSMYMFNPVDTLENELNDKYSITLPSEFTNYISTIRTVTKMFFITSLIGCAAAALTGIFTLLSFCSHGISCISMIIGVITFIAFLIVGGASTGAFLLLRNYLNNSVEEYGVKGSLGNWTFYGLVWGAVVASALTAIFNLFGICCGRTASRPKSQEEMPMMQYIEK